MTLFLPVTIDNDNVPTLVNGITTSMSIIVGFGGAAAGIVFRVDIEKNDAKSKRTYLLLVGLFMVALVYPLGAYVALATKNFEFAVRYSFGGYLIALLSLTLVFIYAARQWNIDENGKCEKQEPELTESEKLKREFQKRVS